MAGTRSGRKFEPGVEAAAYLSSYFVKGKGRKASLTENVRDPNLHNYLYSSAGAEAGQGARCAT